MAWVSSLFGAAPYRLLDWLPTLREDGLSHPESTATARADILPQVLSPVITDSGDYATWTAEVCDFLDGLRKKKKCRTRPRKKAATAA